MGDLLVIGNLCFPSAERCFSRTHSVGLSSQFWTPGLTQISVPMGLSDVKFLKAVKNKGRKAKYIKPFTPIFSPLVLSILYNLHPGRYVWCVLEIFRWWRDHHDHSDPEKLSGWAEHWFRNCGRHLPEERECAVPSGGDRWENLRSQKSELHSH